MVDLEKERRNIFLPPRLQIDLYKDEDFSLKQNLNLKENKNFKKINETCDKNNEGNEEHFIINMQKALYDIKLASLKLIITNLETVNEKIEEDCKQIRELHTEIDEKTVTEIENLKQNLIKEIKYVDELKIRKQKLIQAKENDYKEHAEKMNILAQKYVETEKPLNEHLKATNTECELLEDFKKNEMKLLEKYKSTEEMMQEKDKKLSNKIAIMYDKFKEYKKRLTHNIFEILYDMATKFHVETIENLPIELRRTVNENICIHDELGKLRQDISSKRIRIQHEKSKRVTNLNLMKKHKINMVNNISEFLKKQALLEMILRRHKQISSVVKSIQNYSTSNPEILNVEKIEHKLNASIIKENCLRTVLFQENVKNEGIKRTVLEVICRYELLIRILYDLKFFVSCALRNDKDEIILKMTFKQLAEHLLQVINKKKYIRSVCRNVNL